MSEQKLTAYEAGMLDERAHQNALSRLARDGHQAELDAMQQRITQLEADNASLRTQLAECQKREDVPDGEYPVNNNRFLKIRLMGDQVRIVDIADEYLDEQGNTVYVVNGDCPLHGEAAIQEAKKETDR